MPEPFVRLLSEVSAEGFDQTAEQRSQAFGDRFVELSDGSRALRLVRDRGQWRIDVFLDGEWCEPELLLAALAGRYAGGGGRTAEQLVDMAREVLTRLPVDADEAKRLRETSVIAGRRRPLFGGRTFLQGTPGAPG
jgi:hypothetical protein